MNYKLCTWKRLFCYQCSSDTLYTNLKGSIVPPLPECDLKCQISFLLTTPDQAHRKEAGLLHKVSPGPMGLSDWRHSGHLGAACWRNQKEACRQGMPACVRRSSRTRMCGCPQGVLQFLLCAASQESPERREGRSLLVGFCNAKKMLCVASIFLASSRNQSLRF